MFLMRLIANYVRPIETFCYSFLGITAGSGVGVDSASASTAAAVAGIGAAAHLAKEVLADIRAHDWTKAIADAKDLEAEVPPLLVKAEALAAAVRQAPGA